jgi:N-methylhydantoinase A
VCRPGRGQGYELNLPYTTDLLKKFEQEHHRRYGYAHPTREAELVTLRLRASVKSTKSEASTAHVGPAAPVSLSRAKPRDPGRGKIGSPSTPKAPVQFGSRKLATPIYSRDALTPGKTYHGPAVITEYSATTVIPPNTSFHLDAATNLIVTIR